MENVSSHLSYRASSPDEAEFLAEYGRRCGCGLLLDEAALAAEIALESAYARAVSA